MSAMRILVTNDDGIHAEGLDVCEKIAREISDDVWVIAPEYDQSGVAHSLSLNDPLRLRQVGERRFAVRGTPTDCVIMGARHVLNGKGPDLLLSGVNRGRNAGEDVIYSGTVAGAVEGTVIGVPSLALSQAYAGAQRPAAVLGHEPEIRPRYHSPRHRRRHTARRVDQRQFSRLPAGRGQAHRGHRAGPPRRQERLQIEQRKDGRGNPYYWIAYVRHAFVKAPEGTDLAALEDRCIAVTPLRLDMTDEPYMTKLAELFD